MALTDSLVSYWALEEASGNRADSHGSNTLTDNNTVASATGKISTAADFEASNSEWLSCADNAALSTGDIDFSLSFWVYFESTGYQELAGKWTGGGTDREWLIYTFGGAMSFQVQGPSSGQTVTHGTSLTSGVWYHVVVWHDSVNNVIGITINDTSAVTQAHSGGANDGTADFTLGGRSGSVYFDGLMDEVGFWKKVLSAAEITSLYNGGSGFAYPFSAGGAILSTPFIVHSQAVNRAAFY